MENEPSYWFYDGPTVFANGSLGLRGSRDYNANRKFIVGNILEQSLLENLAISQDKAV